MHSNTFTVVVLLILSSQPIDALTMLGDGQQSRDVHGSLPTYIEWIIFIYVIGKQTLGEGESWTFFVKRYPSFERSVLLQPMTKLRDEKTNMTEPNSVTRKGAAAQCTFRSEPQHVNFRIPWQFTSRRTANSDRSLKVVNYHKL